jgi:hypothetical protein
MRNAYKTLVENHEGKRSLGIPRRRWGDNTRKDLREIGREDADSIHLVRTTKRWRVLMNTEMNIWDHKRWARGYQILKVPTLRR